MTARPGAAAVLVGRHRQLALFAAAIAGRPVVIRAYDGVPSVARAALGQAPWLPGGDADGSDGAAADVVDIDVVALPLACQLFDNPQHTHAALRLEVLRQTGVGSQSVAAALLAQLAASPRPVLLRRLFRIAERVRADAALAAAYPGVAAALVRARREELGRQPRPQPDRRMASQIDTLRRFALGGVPGEREKAAGQIGLATMLDALARLQEPQATAHDSLRVAQWLIEALAGKLRTSDRRNAAANFVAVAWPIAEELATAEGRAAALRVAGEADPSPDEAGPSQDGTRNDDANDSRAHDSRAGRPTRGHGRPGASSADPATLPPAEQILKTTAPAMKSGRALFTASGTVTFHDEWDYQAQQYLRAWVQVREQRLSGRDSAFLQQVRQRHGALARQVRRRFAAIRPELRQRQRRQLDGDDIDLDSAVQHRVERHQGRLGDGRIFTAHQHLRRDVSAAFLMDMSGSTSYRVPDPAQAAGPLPDEQDDEDDSPYLYAPTRAGAARAVTVHPRRVIDVAKEALCLMCDALHGLGDRHAVYGFSGQGRHDVEFHVAKEFHEPWSGRPALAIAAMQPRGYTRTGAAVRHATQRLAREVSRTRALIVITDGYPQDVDYGPVSDLHDHGVHDTAQALREARRAGIHTFCISIDPAGQDFLRNMCPPDSYLVVDDLAELPAQLGKIYRALTTGL